MDSQMIKGILEMCILYGLSNEVQYGYQILKRLSQAFPGTKETTVYAVLRRLCSQGYVEAEYHPHESGKGPPRKYYRVTEKGEEYLSGLLDGWHTLRRAVEQIGILPGPAGSP